MSYLAYYGISCLVWFLSWIVIGPKGHSGNDGGNITMLAILGTPAWPILVLCAIGVLVSDWMHGR